MSILAADKRGWAARKAVCICDNCVHQRAKIRLFHPFRRPRVENKGPRNQSVESKGGRAVRGPRESETSILIKWGTVENLAQLSEVGQQGHARQDGILQDPEGYPWQPAPDAGRCVVRAQ